MNNEEFVAWQKHHFGLFRDDRKKLIDLYTEKGFPGLMVSWKSTLSRHSFASCIEASDLMLSGQVKRPFNVTDIPAVINQAAAEIEAKKVVANIGPSPGYDPKKEVTYDCDKCLDTGYALVLQPGLVQFAYSGTLYGALWHYRERLRREGRVVNAVCDCQRGERIKSGCYNEDKKYVGPVCVDSRSVCVAKWWYPAMKAKEFARRCEDAVCGFGQPVGGGEFDVFGDPYRQQEF